MLNYSQLDGGGIEMTRRAAARGAEIRRPRRGAKGEETRARILSAAESLFAARGFAGTSLDAIADRAGMHTPGILYYFKTKEALYRRVMAEAMTAVEERTQAALTANASPRQRLLRALDSWVDVLVERPNIVRLFLHEAANPNPSGLSKPEHGPGVRAYAAVERAFRDAVPDVHPDDARHFESTIGGSTLFFLAGIEHLIHGGKSSEAAYSVQRHKELLARVAGSLLRGARSM